jgi:hypothetical protein
MLSECPFKHCFICGEHFGGSSNYCTTCMDEEYERVKKDAEIRGLSGDHRDHRFWGYGHDFPNGLCGNRGGPPFYMMCKFEKGHDGPHLCT